RGRFFSSSDLTIVLSLDLTMVLFSGFTVVLALTILSTCLLLQKCHLEALWYAISKHPIWQLHLLTGSKVRSTEATNRRILAKRDYLNIPFLPFVNFFVGRSE